MSPDDVADDVARSNIPPASPFDPGRYFLFYSSAVRGGVQVEHIRLTLVLKALVFQTFQPVESTIPFKVLWFQMSQHAPLHCARRRQGTSPGGNMLSPRHRVRSR